MKKTDKNCPKQYQILLENKLQIITMYFMIKIHIIIIIILIMK